MIFTIFRAHGGVILSGQTDIGVNHFLDGYVETDTINAVKKWVEEDSEFGGSIQFVIRGNIYQLFCHYAPVRVGGTQ